AVAGSFAYIAYRTALTVVYVGNPSAPSIAARLPMTWAVAVTLSGTKTYVIDDGQLKIVDITTPTSPALLSTIGNYPGTQGGAAERTGSPNGVEHVGREAGGATPLAALLSPHLTVVRRRARHGTCGRIAPCTSARPDRHPGSAPHGEPRCAGGNGMRTTVGRFMLLPALLALLLIAPAADAASLGRQCRRACGD